LPRHATTPRPSTRFHRQVRSTQAARPRLEDPLADSTLSLSADMHPRHQPPAYDWSPFYPAPGSNDRPLLQPPTSAQPFEPSPRATIDPSLSRFGSSVEPAATPTYYPSGSHLEGPPSASMSAQLPTQRTTFILPPVVPYDSSSLPPPSLPLLRDRHAYLYGHSARGPLVPVPTYNPPSQTFRPSPPVDDLFSSRLAAPPRLPYPPSWAEAQSGYQPTSTGRPATRRPSAVRPPLPLALRVGPRRKLPPSEYDPPPSPGLLGPIQTSFPPPLPQSNLRLYPHDRQQRPHPYYPNLGLYRQPLLPHRAISQSATSFSPSEPHRPLSLDSFLQSPGADGPYVARLAQSYSDSEESSPSDRSDPAPAPASAPAVVTLADRWTTPSIETPLPERDLTAGCSHSSRSPISPLSPASPATASPLHVSFKKGQTDGKWSVVSTRSSRMASKSGASIHKGKRQAVKVRRCLPSCRCRRLTRDVRLSPRRTRALHASGPKVSSSSLIPNRVRLTSRCCPASQRPATTTDRASAASPTATDEPRPARQPHIDVLSTPPFSKR
jgi:hypothetical protein